MKIRTGLVLASAVVAAVAAWHPVPARSAVPAAAIGAVAAAVPWTGTWAASPQSSGTTFAQQTLRQIVHTSIAGSAIRVQLSNAFGSQPVTISDVHVAKRTSGSSIDASTDQRVTFGGGSSVTIPVGSVAASDSIALTVAASADVVVSFYLPSATGPATSHQLGEQTNYVAAGDVAGNATLSNPQTTGSYFFLANLDVQNSSAQGSVATLGASITDGVASASDTNTRWPNDLATRLLQAGRTIGVLNQGISGNKLLADGSGQSAANRFTRDVLNQPNIKWVIFSDDPINDLGGGGVTGDQLIAATQQLIVRAHQAGIKFLCSTLTPFQGASGWTQAGETGRESFNAFVRSTSSGCDGIVDQDTATHDPANPTRYLPAYDSGDHLHPNTAGLLAIANAVDLNLFGAPAAGEQPYGGTPAGVPGTVQAENYDTGGQGVGYSVSSVNGSGTGYRPDGVDLEPTSDTGGGWDLGWTSGGQWQRYTVSVATAGTYTVGFRVAAPAAVTGGFHLSNGSGGNLTGAVPVPATGGWQTWTTVTASVTLPAGQQVLTVSQDTGGWNLNYLTFTATQTSPGIDQTAWYEVVNQNSSACVDATNSGTANGTVVQQWACGGSANQQWQFTAVSSGVYKVVNRNSTAQNQVWDVTGGPSATAPATPIQTWSYGGGTNQLWQATTTGDGWYTFTASNSGLCLTVPNSSTANGVQLQQNTCANALAQRFKLVPML
jgi:lysophospholipase L1-like esterase